MFEYHRQFAMGPSRDPGFRDLLLGRHVLCCERSRRRVRGASRAPIREPFNVGDHLADISLVASGTQDTTLSDTANGVLYGTFAIAGFFAGSVHVRRHAQPLLTGSHTCLQIRGQHGHPTTYLLTDPMLTRRL